MNSPIASFKPFIPHTTFAEFHGRKKPSNSRLGFYVEADTGICVRLKNDEGCVRSVYHVATLRSLVGYSCLAWKTWYTIFRTNHDVCSAFFSIFAISGHLHFPPCYVKYLLERHAFRDNDWNVPKTSKNIISSTKKCGYTVNGSPYFTIIHL